MPYYLSPPPQSPLTRIIATIITVFALLGAVMLGMVALLVIAGVVLVGGIVIWLRFAWIKRRLRKSGINLDGGINLDADNGVSRESGHVIDAEYTIVPDPDDQKDK